MTQKLEMQKISRRELFKLVGAGVLATTGISLLSTAALANTPATDEYIGKISGGSSAADAKITVELPQIAENGNTVPVKFSVESPMTDANYVKTVHILADKNPAPLVATYNFSPLAGKAEISTRMRLARTQNVVVIAEMSDGTVNIAKKEVKVTIGGCGG